MSFDYLDAWNKMAVLVPEEEHTGPEITDGARQAAAMIGIQDYDDVYNFCQKFAPQLVAGGCNPGEVLMFGFIFRAYLEASRLEN